MKPEKFMSAGEAAGRWGLSPRRVQTYCAAGQICGAEKWGRAWMLPADAEKPVDGRRGAVIKAPAPFIRQSPLLTMTNVLTCPGEADKAAALLGGMPGAALFSAFLQYLRGDIEGACQGAERCLKDDPGFYGQIGGGTLQTLCAMYRGDEQMWNAGRERIRNAPCRGEGDARTRAFWLEAADSAIYGDGGYPEWFCRGDLDVLPADSQPAARFFYLKHLYLQSVNALREKGWADAESVHRVRFMPAIAQPLIAQTRLEGVFVAEIYLRLICAICCHVAGDDGPAAEHIDRAIALALPDKLYGPLAEYEVNLDSLLNDRLRAADDGAYHAVKRINHRMCEGWVSLHNRVLARSVSGSLTTREREAARLAAMGFNNREIAQRQRVSVSTVKQSLRSAMDKTGAQSRGALAKFI